MENQLNSGFELWKHLKKFLICSSSRSQHDSQTEQRKKEAKKCHHQTGCSAKKEIDEFKKGQLGRLCSVTAIDAISENMRM